MPDVVAPVPRVERQGFLERHEAVLDGVNVAAAPVGLAHRPHQRDPARVQRFEQRQRGDDRRNTRVGQFGPARFFVGLDPRGVFGERQLEPAVGVHVAVGHVVNDLSHGPAARPVRRVEFGRRQARDDCAQGGGHVRHLIDPRRALFGRDRPFQGELAHGIAQIVHDMASRVSAAGRAARSADLPAGAIRRGARQQAIIALGAARVRAAPTRNPSDSSNV